MTAGLIQDVLGPGRVLVGSCEWRGVGLHGGMMGCVQLRPAPLGWWLVGRGGERCRVGEARVVDVARRVVIEMPWGERWAGVEHLFAALNGLGLQGVEMALVEGEELPVLDGSAAGYCQAMLARGLVQARQVSWYRLRRPVTVCEGDAWLRLRPSSRRRVAYGLDYGELPPRMAKRVVWEDGADFVDRLAGARTFTFLSWLDRLRASGLARGGSLANAVVFSAGQCLNPDGLRFRDEPLRHKVLDFLGDFALLGRPLLAAAEVWRGGHALHVHAVHALLGR